MTNKAQVAQWLRAVRFGTLSTLVDGAPFGSLVACAADAGVDDGARPIFFLSDLAVHTKALRADARCSLLISDPAAADPQASWRATLVGRAVIDDSVVDAYLQTHPTTQRLGGFHGWALNVERVRTIAGFGAMGWVDYADV